MKTVLALFWVLLIVAGPAHAADVQPKMDVVDMGTLVTGRPSKINVWYQQGECAQSAARLCLADAAATNKVVVFSHGSMGSADNYSWLGNGLAAAGFVVVGVNHYGESSIYGESTQDPRATAFTWQRAQDISALLTKLAGEKLFQRDLDWTNVVAIGHSAGGQTTAALAGARFDLRRIAPYCDSADAKADLGCNYSRNSANASEQFVTLFNADYRDTRVKKIVLLDPALGAAALPDSLSTIALPSLVVGATHNDFLPWQNHGARYAAGIPNAQTMPLGGQEGHFVFLSPCRHSARVMGVALCEDRPGVDRAAVQQGLVAPIVAFVALNNEPAAVAGQPVGAPLAVASYVPSSAFVEIVRHTPIWVFVLLAGLIVFGLIQARTRHVAVWLALLLPAAMPLLSLSGVLEYVGLWWPALVAWLLGVGASALLCLKTIKPSAARYDSGAGKLLVAGSWIPLLVILGIFVVRYAMAVGLGMGLAVAQDGTVQLAVSLLLGGFSGFFLARGVFFWRVHTTQNRS